MPPLDIRKIRILEAVVTDYVSTAKPVGSERLLGAYQMGCKSATIRNEMAEMSEMGYLIQPHTSAGRIPTDRGYRYYVDELMNPGGLSTQESKSANESYRRQLRELEAVVIHTCRLLSRITSYPSLATDPLVQTNTVQRVVLSRATAHKILMVMLFSSGHVEHRILDYDAKERELPSESELLALSNYVTERVTETALTSLSARLSGWNILPEFSSYAPIIALSCAELKRVAALFSERKIFFEGVNQMLRQHEFQDVTRLEGILAALDEPGALLAMLHRMTLPQVAVFIGTENRHPAMQECSLVASWYYIGNKPAGCLGVVGPTRMNYNRATAAVDLMAQNLSHALTALSLV